MGSGLSGGSSGLGGPWHAEPQYVETPTCMCFFEWVTVEGESRAVLVMVAAGCPWHHASDTEEDPHAHTPTD